MDIKLFAFFAFDLLIAIGKRLFIFPMVWLVMKYAEKRTLVYPKGPFCNLLKLLITVWHLFYGITFLLYNFVYNTTLYDDNVLNDDEYVNLNSFEEESLIEIITTTTMKIIQVTFPNFFAYLGLNNLHLGCFYAHTIWLYFDDSMAFVVTDFGRTYYLFIFILILFYVHEIRKANKLCPADNSILKQVKTLITTSYCVLSVSSLVLYSPKCNKLNSEKNLKRPFETLYHYVFFLIVVSDLNIGWKNLIETINIFYPSQLLFCSIKLFIIFSSFRFSFYLIRFAYEKSNVDCYLKYKYFKLVLIVYQIITYFYFEKFNYGFLPVDLNNIALVNYLLYLIELRNKEIV